MRDHARLIPILMAMALSLSGCGALLDVAQDADQTTHEADERARRKFVGDMDQINDERASRGLLPLDECSQCYWKHARWAARVPGCSARVRRWEFGDYTALDPPGVALATTAPVVSDSVQAVYDKRARDDRFLDSKDIYESGDAQSRQAFRHDLQLANARRLQDGLLPLDLCSQSYWKHRSWAMKVDECEPRVLRYESGDTAALAQPVDFRGQTPHESQDLVTHEGKTKAAAAVGVVLLLVVAGAALVGSALGGQ